MMGHRVKIKVRAGRTVHFPGLCVNCTQPAGKPMRVRKRIGRITRLIDVPVCADCAAELQRLSGEEERILQLGRVVAIVTGVIALLLILLLVPGLPWAFELAAALVAALLLAAAVYALFKRQSLGAARPEKQAILGAVRMVTFSWRATTFEFDNETFAQRFADLNRQLLMEV